MLDAPTLDAPAQKRVPGHQTLGVYLAVDEPLKEAGEPRIDIFELRRKLGTREGKHTLFQQDRPRNVAGREQKLLRRSVHVLCFEKLRGHPDSLSRVVKLRAPVRPVRFFDLGGCMLGPPAAGIA